MSGRFKAVGGERIRVRLGEEEADVLRALPDELRALYDAPPGEPARDRLFPRAYLDPTEEEAEQEWEALVHPDLLHRRHEALERVRAGLEGASRRRGRVELELSPDDVEAWLSVLTDARLALGVRLGITEDTDLTRLDASDPDTPSRAAYGWLTFLQGELVDALL